MTIMVAANNEPNLMRMVTGVHWPADCRVSTASFCCVSVYADVFPVAEILVVG